MSAQALMPTVSNRTVICSVVFLDVIEYSQKPVAEQSQLKERLNALLSEAVANVAPNDRVILDTGDGAALSFLGDPEDALFASLTLRDSAAAVEPSGPELQLRIGINLGPVRLVKDLNGQLNIIGDGINVAQRVMGFAEPGQILVSRSYYEVVSRLSKDYEKLFHYEGSRTDKHVREHEVYAIAAISGTLLHLPPPGKPPAVSASGTAALDRLSRSATLVGRVLRRRAWLAAVLVVAAILVGAVGLRMKAATQPQAPGSPASPARAGTRPGPAATAPGKPAASEAPAKPEPVGRPGTIIFTISPWGEVYVDGKRRGVAPPLRDVELKPGKHTIEVRNGDFPPHVESVDVAPGGQTRIKHSFR